jgi:biopolymer transport protein ExbD
VFDSYERRTPTLNLSALIDVVFILVIFVVLAANFQRIREVEVDLPSARTSAEASDKALTLVIGSDPGYLVDGTEVAPEKLADHLKTLRKDHEALLILSDREIPFERAVFVLGEASAAGFQQVSIAAKEPKG